MVALGDGKHLLMVFCIRFFVSQTGKHARCFEETDNDSHYPLVVCVGPSEKVLRGHKRSWEAMNRRQDKKRAALEAKVAAKELRKSDG